VPIPARAGSPAPARPKPAPVIPPANTRRSPSHVNWNHSPSSRASTTRSSFSSRVDLQNEPDAYPPRTDMTPVATSSGNTSSKPTPTIRVSDIRGAYVTATTPFPAPPRTPRVVGIERAESHCDGDTRAGGPRTERPVVRPATFAGFGGGSPRNELGQSAFWRLACFSSRNDPPAACCRPLTARRPATTSHDRVGRVRRP
jgi:hypothetical protein